MAYEIATANAVKITLVAAADLSAAQYKFVKLDSTGKAAAIAAATDLPIGVLQNAPKAGEEAEVLVAGGTKIVLGGTVAIGATVSPKADGTAVAIVHGTDTTKYACGQALAGGASGVIGTALISCGNAGRAA